MEFLRTSDEEQPSALERELAMFRDPNRQLPQFESGKRPLAEGLAVNAAGEPLTPYTSTETLPRIEGKRPL